MRLVAKLMRLVAKLMRPIAKVMRLVAKLMKNMMSVEEQRKSVSTIMRPVAQKNYGVSLKKMRSVVNKQVGCYQHVALSYRWAWFVSCFN